jgi:hypothetical protein
MHVYQTGVARREYVTYSRHNCDWWARWVDLIVTCATYMHIQICNIRM